MPVIGKKTTYSKRNKRKPLQYFLNYLKHAEGCQRGETKDPVKDAYRTDLCKFKLCMYLDQVISHKTFTDCKSSKFCNITACLSSSKTISHCKECSDSNCFICPLIKGKNNGHDDLDEDIKQDSISELQNYFGNLNLLCAIFGEEKTGISCSCGDPIIVNEITKKSDCNRYNKVHLPTGLIIEKNNPTLTVGTKNWHSCITPQQRENHLFRFFQMIISKTDVNIYWDKKLFYFLAFIASIEKELYEISDSKEGYIRILLEKMKEINEEFKKSKEKDLTVQDAAEQFFKNKVVEIIGGKDEFNKVELPTGLTYILGKPKLLLEKKVKMWHKSTDFSDRDDQILKFSCRETFFNSHDYITKFVGKEIFFEYMSALLQIEEWTFYECSSKEKYHYVMDNHTNILTKKGNNGLSKTSMYQDSKSEPDNKTNVLTEFISDASEEKKIKNQSDLDRSKHIIKELSNNKNLDCSNTRKISDPPAFCFSHYLLLTYSVTFQLWKKSKKEAI